MYTCFLVKTESYPPCHYEKLLAIRQSPLLMKTFCLAFRGLPLMQRVEIIINQGQNKQTESTKFQHLIIFDFARLTSSVFCNNFQKERFF